MKLTFIPRAGEERIGWGKELNHVPDKGLGQGGKSAGPRPLWVGALREPGLKSRAATRKAGLSGAT